MIDLVTGALKVLGIWLSNKERWSRHDLVKKALKARAERDINGFNDALNRLRKLP